MTTLKGKYYVSQLLQKARDYKAVAPIKSKVSARTLFLLTEEELARLNKTIRKKAVSDVHIGHSIIKTFRGEITDEQLNVYSNDRFTAGYYSFLDLKQRIIEESCFNQYGIKKYAYILTTILHNIRNFLQVISAKGKIQRTLSLEGENKILRIRDCTI